MGEERKTNLEDLSLDLFSFDSSERIQIDIQSINSFYSIAQESFLNGSYRISVIYLRKILQIDNSYLPAYKLLSKIFQIKGQLNKSAEILRQAIDINFKDAELHYQLGYIYYLQGNKTGFARECTKALVVNPQYSKAFYALALLHFENKRYNKAMEELSKCLELNPNDIDANMLLARVLIRKRDFPKARDAVGNVLKFDPYHKKAVYYFGEISFLLKDYETALSYYLKSGNTSQKIKEKIQKAYKLIREDVEQVLKKEPRNLNALMEEASLYYQVGQLDQAKKSLTKIKSLYPDYLPAQTNYGLMLVYENDFLEAINIYRQVLKKSPMNKEAEQNLETAFTEAEKYFKSNFEEHKNDLLELYMLQHKYDLAVLVMFELQNRKYAKQILENVSSKNIKKYRMYQATVHFLYGEHKEAEYIIKNILNEEKTDPAPFYFIALIEKARSNYVEAYKNFEKARSIEPGYGFIEKEMKAITKIELKKIEEQFKSKPEDVKLNLEYLDLLSMMGYYKQALHHLQKVAGEGGPLAALDLSEQLNKIVNNYEKELESKLEHSKQTVETYIELGKVYIIKKRYYESFLLLQNAITQFKEDQELKAIFDKVVAKSIEVYEELLKTQTKSMLYYNLAVLYAVTNQQKKSFELLRKAIDLDKNYAIQARYEESFKKYRTIDRFRLITIIEGEDKNIYSYLD